MEGKEALAEDCLRVPWFSPVDLFLSVLDVRPYSSSNVFLTGRMGEVLVLVVSFVRVPQTKIGNALFFSAVYARCPSLIVVLDLITRIIRLRATFC